MTIDPYLPLELDDGTPAELVRVSPGNDYVEVKITHSCYRDGRPSGRSFAYWLKDGRWAGGDKKNYFVLRNGPSGPDKIEEMFA